MRLTVSETDPSGAKRPIVAGFAGLKAPRHKCGRSHGAKSRAAGRYACETPTIQGMPNLSTNMPNPSDQKVFWNGIEIASAPSESAV